MSNNQLLDVMNDEDSSSNTVVIMVGMEEHSQENKVPTLIDFINQQHEDLAIFLSNQKQQLEQFIKENVKEEPKDPKVKEEPKDPKVKEEPKDPKVKEEPMDEDEAPAPVAPAPVAAAPPAPPSQQVPNARPAKMTAKSFIYMHSQDGKRK